MSRPKASTGSSSQTPSPPVPATPEPYHPSPIPPLVQTPPTAKPPRTVAKGPPLVMGASWNPEHLGGCVGGDGRWAWHRRCPSVEGSGDLHHQGGRTDESPEQPSSPPLAQLPTASTGPGQPGAVVRGAGLEEAGWAPGWVAELCLSTPWQALQPPLGHCCFSRGACPRRKRV